MATTKYTYSVADDTASGKVGDTIEDEVRASAIVTSYDYYSIIGDVLDVWFKDALSVGDKTILDGLVSAHAGAHSDQGVRADGVQRVQLTPQGSVGSKLIEAGVRFDAELSTDGQYRTTDGETSWPEDREIQGATAVVTDPGDDDEIDFLVVHPDPNVGVVGQFGESLPVPHKGPFEGFMPNVVSEGSTEITAGLKVVIRYRTKKQLGDKPRVHAYLRMHK